MVGRFSQYSNLRSAGVGLFWEDAIIFAGAESSAERGRDVCVVGGFGSRGFHSLGRRFRQSRFSFARSAVSAVGVAF